MCQEQYLTIYLPFPSTSLSPSWEKGARIFSCADAISRVIEKRLGNLAVAKEELKVTIGAISEGAASEGESVAQDAGVLLKESSIVGVCSDCGGVLRHEEGCVKCHSCGFSKC